MVCPTNTEPSNRDPGDEVRPPSRTGDKPCARRGRGWLRHPPVATAALGLLALLGSTAALANVSRIDESHDGDLRLSEFQRMVGQPFTTGPDAWGYRFRELSIWIGSIEGADNFDVGVDIHLAPDAATGLGPKVMTLRRNGDLDDREINSYIPVSGADTVLDPNTRYAVVFTCEPGEGLFASRRCSGDEEFYDLMTTNSNAHSFRDSGWNLENWSVKIFGGGAVYGTNSETLRLTIHSNSNLGAPHIVEDGIRVTSTPGGKRGDTTYYALGDSIVFQVQFSEVVSVHGGEDGSRNPTLRFQLGNQVRSALYRGVGTGTDTLQFSYIVEAGDVDNDGIRIDADAFHHNIRGSVRDNDFLPSIMRSALVGTLSGHKVDGGLVRPEVSSVSISSSPLEGDTYWAGEDIQVTASFTRPAQVEGSAAITIDLGGGESRRAPYVSGGGSRDLVFEYEVRPEDSDSDGLSIPSGALAGPGPVDSFSIWGADSAAARARLGLEGVNGGSSHKVDGSLRPSISSVAFTSEPLVGDTYGLGEVIELTATFSEKVLVTGTPPQARVGSGSDENQFRLFSYARGSGTDDLVYVYTVKSEDVNSTGYGVPQNGLGVTDPNNPNLLIPRGSGDPRIVSVSRGGPANMASSPLDAQPGHKVDGSLEHLGNASLSGLSLWFGNLEPEFDSEQTSYTMNLTKDVFWTQVDASTASEAAAVTISPDDAFERRGHQVSLNTGSNPVAITVTSPDGNTTRTYTVDVVRAANNPPTSADNTVTIAEDTQHSFTSGDFDFSDLDDDTLDSVVVETLPTAGTLTLGGDDVDAGDAVDVRELADLVFSPVADGNGAGYASFKFRVHDGEHASESTYTMSVDVTAVQDAPVVADGLDDQVAVIGTPFRYQVPAGAFTDVDGDTLFYSATLDDGGALPAWLRFDAPTRTFSGTAGASDTGTLAVKVTARDSTQSDARSAMDEFTLQVQSAPKLTLVLSRDVIDERDNPSTTDVNETLARVTATLPYPAGRAFTVQVTPTPVAPTLASDYVLGSNTTLTFSADATSSTGVVTISARDNSDHSRTRTLTVSGSTTEPTVQAPDDVTLTIRDDEEMPTLGFTDASVRAEEEDGELNLTVALSVPGRETIEVDYETVEGTAEDGVDFEAATGMLSFAPGETDKMLAVVLVDDTIALEPTRGFSVELDGVDSTKVALGENSTVSVMVEDPNDRTRVDIAELTNVDEDAGSVDVMLSLSEPAAQEVTVDLRTRDDVATAPEDYVAINESVRFPAGETMVSASLSIMDDDIDEPNERFEVVLARPTGLPDNVILVDGTSIAVVIRDDDERGYTLSGSPVEVTEGGSGSFSLVLLSQPTAAVTFLFRVTGDEDITVSPGSVTFSESDWDQEKTVTVSAAHDANAEDDTGQVLFSISGGDYGGERIVPVRVNVSDDETASTALSLSLDRSSLGEDSGTVTVTVTGSLDSAPRASETEVAVSVGSSADTAVEGEDYAAVGELTLVIPADQTSGSVSFEVTPVNDRLDEENEAISVGGTAEGLVINGTTLMLTDDDERGVELSGTSLTVREGGTATYSVALTSQPTGTVTVTPTVSGSADVSISPASLSFTPTNWIAPQAVVVSAAADLDAEDEEASIAHEVSGADYGSETAAGVSVSVEDDETASTEVELELDVDSVDEDGGARTLTVTGTLDHAPHTSATQVRLTVGASADSATIGEDYQPVAALTLTIEAGMTSGTASFTFTPIDDDLDEELEQLTVDGTSQGLTVVPARLSIEDDDERGIEVSPTSLSVEEGGTATYSVVLESQPTGTVTVTATASGSPEVSTSPASLSFTPTNWNVAQTVTVSGGEDIDAEQDEATINHRVSGADYGSVEADSVSVIVNDDEIASQVVALNLDLASVVEGAGARSMTLTATLDSAPQIADTLVTVVVGAPADDASKGVDYVAVTDIEVTIRAGQQSGEATFSFAPIDDELDELDEGLTLSGTAQGLSVEGTALMITDDDERGVEVSETSLTVDEGGTATYSVVLASQPTGTVTVTPRVSGSSDVSTNPTSLSFTPANWRTAQTVVVRAAGDIDAEDEEASIAHDVSGADYGSETVAGVTVTVEDDETASTQVALELDAESVDEDGGAGTLTVTGTLDHAPSVSATQVRLTVGASADTATSGADYAPVAALTLTIEAGMTSGTASFSLAPIDDDLDEELEHLTVNGTSEGLTVVPARLGIEDDDERGVEVSPTSLTLSEGSSGTYSVKLLSQPTGTVQVTPLVAGDDDVTIIPASLSFTATNWNVEQSVTVSGAEDVDAERDEATIAHRVSGADYGSVSVEFVFVTVNDNEIASQVVTLSLDPNSMDEDEGTRSVTLTATLDGAPLTAETQVMVTVGASGDDATEGVDYAAVADIAVTIRAGQQSGEATFSFTPVDDDLDELDESLTLSGTASDLRVDATTLEITDDDERGVEVSEESLTVDEGGTATYSVVLASQPSGTVTVTPRVSGSSDVSTNPTSLSFTPTNWRTAQTVVVRAAGDVDAEDEEASIAHDVSGADYGSETAAEVSVAVEDDETFSTQVELELDTTSVDEDGGTSRLTVTGTLDHAPSTSATEVLLTVGVPGDSAISGTDYERVAALTLTIEAGMTSGTTSFTFAPVDDDLDEELEQITVNGTSDGLAVVPARLSLEDDDERGVEVSPTSLTLTEGSSGTYSIKLLSQPTDAVTLTPSVIGDGDVTLSPASIVFTPSNWATPLTLRVTAAQDVDAEHDRAEVTHVLSGADYAGVAVDPLSVLVNDDEIASQVVALSLDPTSVDEGAGTRRVTLRAALDGAPRSTDTLVTVAVGASADDATEGVDYLAVSDIAVTIPARQQSGEATFSFTPVDDQVDELLESLTLAGSAQGLRVDGTVLEITDDDERGVEVSEDSLIVEEGGTATYSVVLLSQPTGTVTVTPTVSGSSDVSTNPTSLRFTSANWGAAQTVVVLAAADSDSEDDEASIAHSLSGGDYGSETAAEVSVTVEDDERPSLEVRLSVAAGPVGEGVGRTNIDVTATLDSAPISSDILVTLSVGAEGDSALEGSDYQVVEDLTLTIAAGQTSGVASFTLAPVDDDLDEEVEHITVEGTSESLAVIPARISIEDDDERGVEVSPTSLTLTEGSSAEYRVRLLSQPTGTVTLTPSVIGDSDVTVSPASFEFTPSNWQASHTLRVTAAQDVDAEHDSAEVSHVVSGADYATVVVDPVSITVNDNEIAASGVTLSLDTSTLGEGEPPAAITLTATLNGAPRTSATEVRVVVGASSDAATRGVDYQPVEEFTVTIPRNRANGSASFEFAPINDSLAEGDEVLTLTGTASEPGLDVGAASFTIRDDDERGVEVSVETLSVREGGTATYSLMLASQPTGTVTVTPSVPEGVNATLAPALLEFTAENWNLAQEIVVSAEQDMDAMNEEAEITHAISGADYDSEPAAVVALIVNDDEVISEEVTLTVDPLRIDEDAGPTEVTVTGTLDGATIMYDTLVTISLGAPGDSAESGVDYAVVNEMTLVIPAGDASGMATFMLSPTDDDLDEANELLTVVGTTGDAGLAVAGVEIAILDDDERGVRVSVETLTLDEGSTASYTVVLASEPTGTVTVTPSVSGDAELQASPESLRFTPENWAVPQEVSLTAGRDNDAEDGSAVVLHAVSGADYGAETEVTVIVTVVDEDSSGGDVPDLGDDTGSVISLSLSADSLDEGGGAREVTVTGMLDSGTRTSDTLVTITLGAPGDSAESGVDYAAVDELTLTILAGESNGTASFTLTPTDDDLDELDERITLDGTTGDAELDVTTAVIAILDNDQRGLLVSLETLTLGEGGTATYTVALTSEPTGTVTVMPSVSGAELQVSPESLSFTPENWSVAQEVSLTSGRDGDAEDGAASLSHAVSGADYGSVTAGEVSVAVSDTDTASRAVALSLSADSVDEDAGATEVTVTGMLDSGTRTSDTLVTITLGAPGDSAETGTDYVAVDELTLMIAAGESSGTATFTLSPTDDDLDEADEVLTVAGTSGDAGLAVNSAEIAILDDDERGVRVSVETLTLDEGGTAAYTLVLTSQPTGTVTVMPSVAGDADLQVRPGSLRFTPENWAVAQRVSLTAERDSDAEDGAASVSHAVSGADYGSATATATAVTVVVSDSDEASQAVALSLSAESVDEDAGATDVTVTGTLDGATRTSDTRVTISLGAPGDSAEAEADYAAVDELTLTITAGEQSGTATFRLSPTDDDLDEADERLTVAGTTGDAGLAVSSAEMAILDDDERGVRVSVETLQVDEGGTASYTLVLMSEPDGTVMVMPSVSGDADLELSPGSLRFTPENWAVSQRVSLTAGSDTDAEDGAASVSHAVSGADYGSVTAAAVTVVVSDTDEASRAVALSLSLDSVDEDGGARDVTVTGMLDGATRTSDTLVTIALGSPDDSAEAGLDYAAVDGLTLAITAGEWSGTASFTLSPTNDDLAEADELLTVGGTTLDGDLRIEGAQIAITDDDTLRQATGTMQEAWLARFGRTAADHVFAAVKGRREASRTEGSKLRIGSLGFDSRNEENFEGMSSDGREVTSARAGESQIGSMRQGSLNGQHSYHHRPQATGDALGMGAQNMRASAMNAPGMGELISGGAYSGEVHGVRGHHHGQGTTSGLPSVGELISGASYALNSGSKGLGSAALWASGAITRFDDDNHLMTLDGEVQTGMVGFDWSFGRNLAGVVVSHSRGEGGYQSWEHRGDVETTLTGIYPWGSMAIGDRLTLWGVAGYGAGTLRIEQDDSEKVETDTDLAMAAFDLSGVLWRSSEDGGLELLMKSDVLMSRATSDATQELAETEADVTRVRLGLEGGWRMLELGDAALSPRIEVALRHDGGDAETGYGADLGVGLDLTNPVLGLEAQLRARGLVTHEDDGFAERGLSASLIWDPRPESEVGPRLELRHVVGASATGGAEQFLRTDAIPVYGENVNSQGLAGRPNLQATLGYGLELFGGRFTGLPEIALGHSGMGREANVGWRMEEAHVDGLAFSWAVNGGRVERDSPLGGADQRVGFELRWRLEGLEANDPAFEIGLTGSRRTTSSRELGAEYDLGINFRARW